MVVKLSKKVEKMVKIKGQKEFEKFKKGFPLTRKEAMLAKCYECNGEGESKADCEVTYCPMYEYRQFKNPKRRLA